MGSLINEGSHAAGIARLLPVSPATGFAGYPLFSFATRFHLQTVRLKADLVVGVTIVDIRIRTRSIGRHLTARRATYPQIHHPLPAHHCLGGLLVKIVAGTSALPPGRSLPDALHGAFSYTVLTKP